MPTIQSTPGLQIDLLPHGAPGDPLHAPAVRIRREGGDSVVVYLPEVKELIDTLATAAAETAAMVVKRA